MTSEPISSRRAIAFAAAAALLFTPAASHAVSQTFGFSGFTLPDDTSGIQPNVSIEFIYDDTCGSNCVLRIDLDYLDSNAGNGLTANPQGLAGVTWDMQGGAALRDAASQTGADVIAPTLVGVDAATAAAELTDKTVDGVSGEQVTRHWGVRDDLAILFAALGTNVLSSVGDVTVGATTQMGFIGMSELLPDGVLSSVELNPPDGIPFAVVDPFTTMLTGTAGDKVLAQSTVSAFLYYDGTLTSVDNVAPLFGTDGVVPVPEPTTGALVALALASIALASPRRE